MLGNIDWWVIRYGNELWVLWPIAIYIVKVRIQPGRQKPLCLKQRKLKVEDDEKLKSQVGPWGDLGVNTSRNLGWRDQWGGIGPTVQVDLRVGAGLWLACLWGPSCGGSAAAERGMEQVFPGKASQKPVEEETWEMNLQGPEQRRTRRGRGANASRTLTHEWVALVWRSLSVISQ